MTTQFHFDLRAIARALGGHVAGAEVLAPGLGHGPRDRSLSFKLSATSRDGFTVHSFAGDDWRMCRDHVRSLLGIAPDAWRDTRRADPPPRSRPEYGDEAERERAKVLWFWRQRRPIGGSIAETYLRQARGYSGALPVTLAYLPARDGYEPALIAAFGLASEREPSVLAISDASLVAVQLIKLKPDGSGKADIEPNKIIIGKGGLGSPIVLAPPNDFLGLAITEGLEDALSIHQATGLGAWASGGAGRMPALADAVPSYIDCVNIFGDDDDTGRRGATELAARLRARGFEVILKILSASSST